MQGLRRCPSFDDLPSLITATDDEIRELIAQVMPREHLQQLVKKDKMNHSHEVASKKPPTKEITHPCGALI